MGSWQFIGYDPDEALDANIIFATLQELEHALSSVMERATAGGSILDVRSPSGNVLSFAVVEDHGYVHFETPDKSYFWAVGMPALSRDDGVVAFAYLGQESEIPLRNCIRPEQVLPLVREFFETDARPTSIEWEEV